MLQAADGASDEPEFHGDNTAVFWRFGYDLTDRLRQHDWPVHALCTAAWADALATGHPAVAEPHRPEFDLEDMLAGAPTDDFEVAADAELAARLGSTRLPAAHVGVRRPGGR